MRKLIRKLLYLLQRDQRADELAEEMEFHRSLAEQEGVGEGLTPKDAARRARRRMGNETLSREDARSVWSFPIVDELWQDLRYGVRVLSRNASSTVVTVLALAIGIGVNTAVFTFYKATIARPLDARNPGEMVNIALTRDSGESSYTFSYPDYEIYRDSIRSFSGVVAFRSAQMTLSNAGRAVSQRSQMSESLLGSLTGLRGGTSDEIAAIYAVSENYFEVLGVTALRGRTFESISGSELVAEPPVLISENYWQRRFAGDPAIIGKTIYLNRVPVTIIGVTPRDFVGTGTDVPSFWLAASLEPLVNANDRWLYDRENERYRLFGRLAPGASIAQAQADMSRVAEHVRTLHDPLSEPAKPATALVWPGSPAPLPLEMNKGLRWTILLIIVATGIVLAVACANVATLQLARARSRENELRTRLSLGACRLRVVRQLLTESALVGLLAGPLALLCTWALLKKLGNLLSQTFSFNGSTVVFDGTPDIEIFVFVFAISLFAGMLSGLAPAMESSHAALATVAGAGTSSVRSRRLQDLLVTVQVSLSLVLLIVAGMLIRSSLNALHSPTGYDNRQVIFLGAGFTRASEYTDAHRLTLIRELRSRLAALPGVAAITSARPPAATQRFETVAVPLNERSGGDPSAQSMLGYTYVEANYFQTLGIPILLGRGFQPQGREPEQSVILSESAANELWPNQNPIGRSLRLGPTDEQRRRRTEMAADGPAYQVVGVARDKRVGEFNSSLSDEIYLPLRESQLSSRPILIRVEADPAQVRRAIDPMTSSIDPNMWSISATLEEMLRLSGSFLVSIFAATVATTVGSFALLLAVIGIYGTVSYVVVLRTREVGIRMAIGAQRSDVLGLILRETARPVLVGLLFGMLLAVGVSYLGRGWFYGIDGVDRISLAGVSSLFLAVALLASYLPSRRALCVDPMVTLRSE